MRRRPLVRGEVPTAMGLLDVSGLRNVGVGKGDVQRLPMLHPTERSGIGACWVKLLNGSPGRAGCFRWRVLGLGPGILASRQGRY